MSIGFDLTQFGSLPKPKPTAPPQRPVQQAPVQRQQPIQEQPIDPQAPQTIQDALTASTEVDSSRLVDENGNQFSDKLGQKAPDIKRATWQIDKFGGQVRPVQITVQKKGESAKKIWVDGNGNVPLDPETGEILIRSTQLPKAENEKE